MAVAVGFETVVVATAGMPVDRVTRYFAKAEHLVYWEMIAHGKMIELTSGRWKEIWLSQRGDCVLVRLPPVGFGRYSRCLPPFPSLRCISCTLRPLDELIGIGTYGQKKIGAGPAEGFWDAELLLRGVSRRLLMYM